MGLLSRRGTTKTPTLPPPIGPGATKSQELDATRHAATLAALVAWIWSDWECNRPDRRDAVDRVPESDREQFLDEVNDVAVRLLGCAVTGKAAHFLAECGRMDLAATNGLPVLKQILKQSTFTRRERDEVEATVRRLDGLWDELGQRALQLAPRGEVRGTLTMMLAVLGASLANPSEVVGTAGSPGDAAATLKALGSLEQCHHFTDEERGSIRRTRELLQEHVRVVAAVGTGD